MKRTLLAGLLLGLATYEAAACRDENGRPLVDSKSGAVAACSGSSQSAPSNQLKPLPVPRLDDRTLDAKQRQDLREAMDAERANDYRNATRQYRRLARAGHAPSAMRLSEIFEKGATGVPRDPHESSYWAERARALGGKAEVEGKR